MKLFLALLCFSGTVLAELTTRDLSDCIDAVNAAFGLTQPELKFSVASGATALKTSPSLSTYTGNGKLQYATVGSSSSYESAAGISGYAHNGGPLKVTKYVAPVKSASYEPAVTYAKGGAITYADKSPASKFAAVVPSGIEFKNLVTPVISTKKVSNAYLPPITSNIATYQSPGYTYSPATPAVLKTATYASTGSGAFGNLGHLGLDLGKVTFGAAPVATKIQSFTSPGYTFSEQSPGFSKIETYASGGYSKGGGLESIFSSGAASPFESSISYAPKVTYGAPTVTKLNTLSTHSNLASFSAEPLLAKGIAPTAAVYAPSISNTYLPTVETSSYGKYSGGTSHQYVSQLAPVYATQYVSAPAKVATYAAPEAAHYISSPVKVATYSSGEGHLTHGGISHQYVSKPVSKITNYVAPVIAKAQAAYVAPAVAKVAAYVAPSVRYSSGGSVSQQYVSKPVGHVRGYAAPVVSKVAPVVAKVAAYSAPAYIAPAVAKVAAYAGDSSSSHYSSAGGAVSHQYVSKPAPQVTAYAAPAIAKIATYEAPALTKVATYSGDALSHQYVSKPAVAQVAAYAAPAVAVPVVSKVASYSGESSAHLGGAISHQYVSKPTAHITGYAAPAVAKVATYSAPVVAAPVVASYAAPAAVKVGGYSQASSAHFSSSGGGAVSHQYVSKPSSHISGYSAPAVAKVASYAAPVVAAPAKAQVATYGAYAGGESSLHYSSGSGGAVSHQYVSKPAPQSIAYAAPAVPNVVPLAAPAIVAAPAAVKVASYSGGGSSQHYSGSGGAVSHQYISKPTAHVTGYAAPTVAKVATYAAPAVVNVGGYSQAENSAHFSSSSGGAVSHQYVSKPTAHISGYATPAVAAPAVKAASYSEESAAHFSSIGGGHGAVSHQYVSKPAAHSAVAKVAAYAAPAFAHGASGQAYGSLHTHNINPLVTSSSISRYDSHGAITQQYLAKPVQLGQYTADGDHGESKYSTHGAVSHQYVSKPAVATTLAAGPAIAKVAYGSKLASAGDVSSHQYVSQPLQAVHLSAPTKVVGDYAKLDSSSLHTSSIHGGSAHGGAISHQYVSKPLQGTLTAPIVVEGSGHLTTGAGKYSSQSSGYITSGAHHGSVSHQYIPQPSLIKGGALAAPALHIAGGQSGIYTAGGGAISHQHQSKHGIGLANVHGGILGGGLHSSAEGNYYGAISLGHSGISPAIGGVVGLAGHGLSGHSVSVHGNKGVSANVGLAHGSLGHSGPLAGYDHGVGGIGPLGAGFYRYAPAVPAVSSHALSPTAYLKSAPTIKPAKIQLVSEKHLEYYNDHARYAFEYGVNDPTTGDIKHQREERDGDVVRGEYSLVEPDGNVRTVKYYADWETGFHAEVINSRDSVKTLTKRTASKS